MKPSIVKPWIAAALSIALCATSSSIIAFGDDDDKPADAGKQAAQPTLSDKQQQAVGIVVARPVAAKTPPPQRVEVGTVELKSGPVTSRVVPPARGVCHRT